MLVGGPRLHWRTSAVILGAMWRIVLVAASMVPLASCASQHAHPEQYGAMRAVMREGKTEARVTVCDVADGCTRYGVGALEGLSGEVTIDSGEVWVSRVEAGKPVTTGPGCASTDRATLLSVGSIENPVTSTIEIAAGARLSVPGNAHEARAEREFPGTADRIPDCRRAIHFRTVLAQGSK